MTRDSFTEISSKSWFDRLGGSIKGVLAGTILILIGFALLFWNEGRAVERYKTLLEGGGVVVSVSPLKVEDSYEGNLVHLSGRAETDATLIDREFGVRANAISLIRRVEMYQWKESSSSETRKKLGGGEETITRYNYSKVWEDRLIDSGGFRKPEGHINPVQMAYRSKTLTADKVQVGAYTLPPFLVKKIGNETLLQADGEKNRPENENRLHKQGHGYYLGNNPESPQIGDLRIMYSVVLPTDISLVARQRGSTFEPYRTKAGGSIAMLEMGLVPAETMFEKAHAGNTALTWGLRLAGFILMTAGFGSILRPLVVFADVIPQIGSLLGVGVKFISLLLASLLSFLTIGTAWLFFRPLLGIGLLAVSAAVAFFTYKKVRKADPVLPPPIPAGRDT